jgi:hypothetical protein
LCAGDRGCAGNRKACAAQGGGRSRHGVPGRHQVIDDHHPGRPGRSDSLGSSDELARRSDPPLGGGELSGIRPVGGQGQDRDNLDRDATPAQDADRMPGQPLDMLAAPTTGHRVGGRDGDEPHRPVPELGDGRRQRDGQRPRQVAATPLLVGQQAGPDDPGVVGGHDHRWQAWWGWVGTVLPRTRECLPAPLADGSAGGGAADAPAWQGQVGQDGEHETTVQPSGGSR